MISTSLAFLSSAASAAQSAMLRDSFDGAAGALSETRAGAAAPARAGLRKTLVFFFKRLHLASRANLPLADHDPLFRRQTLETHGTVSVQLRGGDADFRAEAE